MRIFLHIDRLHRPRIQSGYSTYRSIPLPESDKSPAPAPAYSQDHVKNRPAPLHPPWYIPDATMMRYGTRNWFCQTSLSSCNVPENFERRCLDFRRHVRASCSDGISLTKNSPTDTADQMDERNGRIPSSLLTASSGRAAVPIHPAALRFGTA